MTKPTLRRNGKRMLTVRITRHLDKSDLVDMVAYCLASGDRSPSSKAGVIAMARQLLREDGGYDSYWMERWNEDTDEHMGAAEELIDKLWPEMNERTP